MTTSSNAWQIDGVVNVGADTGTSAINGEQVTFTSTTVTVGANSVLDINAPKVWSTTGNLVTNAGAVTRMDGATTFNSAGTFTGAGTLRIGGNATVATPTTFNMPTGTVDLDGSDTLGNAITLNANLTINAATMSSFGNTNIIGGNDTIFFGSFTSLTVNLTDPSAEWTLSPLGVLDINAIGGMLGGGGVQGSDFNMNGTANISGNSIWTARTDIAGTVNVAAGGTFNLRGGTLADTNRLIGGTITGAGVVRALADEALVGFGTINTDIDFANNTELRADDGTLNVNAPILDVGVIGTADVDGILNIPAAWNTGGTINSVQMLGGEIRGGAITNSNPNGIQGFGLLSSPVTNNTRLEAEGGGTLIVQTAANNNDLDGTADTGILSASTGNLEVRDNVGFAFDGSVIVAAGREVFANGFQLQFEASSNLNLTGGAYRSTAATNIFGSVTVNAGADSTIGNDVSTTFGNGSTTALTGNLRLESPLTVVNVGADFTGNGILINRPARTIRLLDAVTSTDLAVLIENQGTLQLGDENAAGQVTGVEFQQTATGTWSVDLGGTGLNQFDRLNLTGAMSLAGTLDLNLIGGLVPVAGDEFDILTAISRSGTFTDVIDDYLGEGLFIAAVYGSDSLTLITTQAGPGDTDLDGDVDLADLGNLATSFGLNNPTIDWINGDFDGDDDVDLSDLGTLATNFEGGRAAALAEFETLVPEPACLAILALSAIGLRRGRR